MTVLDDMDGITELEKFSPERVDAVDHPATALPWLLLKRTADPAPQESTEKAVAPVPEADPKPPETETAQDAPAPPDPEAQAPAEAVKSAPEAEAEAATEAEETAKSADAAPDMVNVDLPVGASVSISPADLAKLATLKQRLTVQQAELAKRDMNPNVGGGVDVDALPASAFVFPATRDFPVVRPGDVSDAASSWGRYKGSESFATFKSRLTALAEKKGAAYVKELPQSWKDDGGKAAKAEGEEPAEKAAKPKPKGKKKAFPGAAPPFKAKPKDGGADADAKGKDAGDGDGDDADDDAKAEKSASACKGCGGDMAKGMKFCPNCGEDSEGKAAKARGCKCGAAMAKGQKFCTDCGTKAGKTAKAAKAFPADAKVDQAISQLETAADAALAAQAKDPDAQTHPADRKVNEALEQVKDDVEAAASAQAEDERTDTAAGHEAKKSAAEAEVPAYHLARLHDATCAAYEYNDVVAAYPAVAKGIGSLVDPQAFAALTQAALAEDGGTGSRAADIPSLSAGFAHAVAIKAAGAQEGALDEAMDTLRKAFADMYPDAHPTPGGISPGEFKRPYVSAGHANQSARPGQEPRIPMASHVPEASDFRRPLITAGREAGSPGSNPSGVGKARSYYTNAARDGAAQALAGMHDWIADNHPGICAMTGASFDGEPGQPNSMGSSLVTAQPVPAQMTATKDKAVPSPVSPAAASAVVTPAVTKAAKKAAKAARKAEQMANEAAEEAPAAVPASPAIDLDMLSGMLGKAVADQLGDVIKTIGDLNERIAAMESAPDPAQMAPRSGTGMAKNAGLGPEVPAGGDGIEADRLVRLVQRSKDPDGNVRAAAIGELIEKAGREGASQLLEAAY